MRNDSIEDDGTIEIKTVRGKAKKIPTSPDLPVEGILQGEESSNALPDPTTSKATQQELRNPTQVFNRSRLAAGKRFVKRAGALVKKGGLEPAMHYNCSRGEVHISIGNFGVSGLSLPLRKRKQLQEQVTAPAKHVAIPLVQTYRVELGDFSVLKYLAFSQFFLYSLAIIAFYRAYNAMLTKVGPILDSRIGMLVKRSTLILKKCRRALLRKRLVDGCASFYIKSSDGSSERVEILLCQTTLLAPRHEKCRGSLFIANQSMLDGAIATGSYGKVTRERDKLTCELAFNLGVGPSKSFVPSVDGTYWAYVPPTVAEKWQYDCRALDALLESGDL